MSDSGLERLNSALEGRYALERQLGEGGVATVYLAKDLRHDRTVALKVLKPDLAASVDPARFIETLRAAAGVQHANILPLFESGVVDAIPYWVMPFIRGETLRDKLDREKQLGVDEAWQIARSVAAAVDHAHGAGLLHLDLKPANILLYEGRSVVADFGVVSAVVASGGVRPAEPGPGTPHYMSPERAAADQAPTARSDVYSLGCVFYEMLAGQPPHTAINAQKVLAKVQSEAPRPVTELRPTVPPQLSAVVMKAMEKAPANRFGSAGAFVDALANASFVYAQAAPVQSGSILEVTRSRRQLVPLLGAATVLALILAVVGWLRGPGGGNGQTLRLTLDIGDIVPAGAAVSPDGSSFVVADETRGLFLRRAQEEEFQGIPGTEGGVLPAFSQDGAGVSFSRGGAIQRVDLGGGGVRTLIPAPTAGPLTVSSWSDDGTVVGGGPGGLWRLRSGDAEPENLSQVLRMPLRSLELLPDGSGLLFSGPDPGVWLADLSSESVLDLGLDGYSPTYSRSGHILFAGPGGVLYAAPFDLGSHRVSGPRVAVKEGLLMGEGGALVALSEGGTLLYMTGEAPSAPEAELLLFDAASGRELGKLPLPPDSYEDGRYAPDGNRLALEVRRGGHPELFLFDSGTRAFTQLTFEGDNHQPRWSPDGTRLAFASNRPGTRGEDVWAKVVDGGPPEAPLFGSEGDEHVDAWPVDSLMVIMADRGRDVLRLGRDSRRLPLVRDAGDVGDVDVSPDGRFAAYVTYEGAERDIFLTRFPNGSGRWRITEEGGVGPLRWSPNGRTIYYGGTGNRLMAVDVRTEPSVAVTNRRVVLENAGGMSFWEVHPDGKRILVGDILPSDDARGIQRFWVVANWHQELEAITRGSGR